MLGGWNGWKGRRTGKPIDSPKERWKPSLRTFKAVIDFVKSTDRLRGKKVEDEGGKIDEERMEMENRAAGNRGSL